MDSTSKRREIEVGDVVAYTPVWLHSTGQPHGEVAHYRGVVQEVRVLSADLVVAEVEWTLNGVLVFIGAVNILNIARFGTARSIDVPLWAHCAMSGKKVTHGTRDAIDTDNRARRERNAQILATYRNG